MGERFGRYELLRRLGAGGMAEVFVAKTFGAEGFVKHLVIKRILPAFNEDPDFVRMFIDEARLAAQLQHTNIVQIYDFNHVDGIYYIAMEWVDGLDLRNVFNTARRRAMSLPLRMGVHVGVETLKGLHYAHCRAEGGQPLALVHRDISPHNLLVSFSGEVKITDFGIAKAAAIASATRSGAVKGKLPYMSPEQVSGVVVDARSDLFSLGVVLWELLAGQRLYQAQSEGELFAKVRRAEVPPLPPLNAEVPVALERVIRRLLAPSPGERFQSAAEALGELSPFAEADNALQVAGYLCRLLPDEASRDRRGETRVDPAPRPEPGGVMISPQGPTRTRDAGGAADAEVVGSAAEAGGARPGGPLPGRDPGSDPGSAAERSSLGSDPGSDHGPDTVRTPSDEDPGIGRILGVQRTPRRWALVAAVSSCFAASGVLAYWLTTRPPASPAMSSLVVDTDLAGADVSANEVPLGAAPLLLQGPSGTMIRIQARWRDRPAQQRALRLGSEERVQIRAEQPAGFGPGSRPAATSATRPAADPPRPPVPNASRKARGPERQAWATIDVLVAPWARVRIDREDRGQTPLKRVRLPAGIHVIELVNPDLGRRDTHKVRLRPDEHTVIRHNWTP